MKLLKTINPEKVEEKDIASWERREAARAVVFDDEGRIGLLHVTKQKYYKLPGGGLEEGEDIELALDRECEEELGIKIKIDGEVGQIVEYRSKFKLKQTSYCFFAKVNSEKGIPSFTDEEIDEGFEAVWVKPDGALKLLNLKQTSDYEGKFIEERDFCFLTEGLKSENL